MKILKKSASPYVARKLRRTSASRFGTGIEIRTLWKLTESRFQNASKIFSLKTCWKLMIPFWNHASYRQPRYFIDEKRDVKRLVLCCCDVDGRAWIYVVGESKLISKTRLCGGSLAFALYMYSQFGHGSGMSKRR